MFLINHKIKIATHDGSFHPDDVFAVAALSLLFHGETRTIRTRNPEIIAKADYVIDVGDLYDPANNYFDHHQIGGAGQRQNGVPYAAFGLVWKQYGEKIAKSKEVAEIVDRDLVQYIDAIDNGVGELKPITGSVLPFTIGTAIMNMNPVGNPMKIKIDLIFKRATLVALEILRSEIEVAREELSTRGTVEEIYRKSSDKRLIIFDIPYPWSDVLKKYPEPFFVVEPRDVDENGRQNWEVTCVRDNPNNFKNRKDLPIEWAGKRDGELARATGVSDAVFCHNKRFMAVSKSKTGALALAKLALGSPTAVRLP